MKKILICALAVGMFTACSQEETISTQAPMQISFAGAFVENATRAAADPSITTANITGFDVYGFMDTAGGAVFTGDDVTGSKDAGWSYTNTQYWLADHNYYFAALAPMNHNNIVLTPVTDDTKALLGAGSVKFTNLDGSDDLIYSAVGPYATSEAFMQAPTTVKFTFNHLLSKVKFTFKNGFTNPNSKLVITDVKMTAPKVATIDLATDNWWKDGGKWALSTEANNSVTLEFGDVKESNKEGWTATKINNAVCVPATESLETAKELLTIPAAETQEYTITYKVLLYQGDVAASQTAEEHTVTLNGIAFEMGKAYNLTAEINADNYDQDGGALKPIEFEVIEVLNWDYAPGDVAVAQNCDTKEELLAAIEKGGDIVLNADINLGDATLEITKGKTVTIDLNGKTVSTTTDGFTVSGGILNIKGDGTVKAATNNGTEYCAVWAYGDAVVNIYGGTYEIGYPEGDYNDLIYAKENASINIYGGTFKNSGKVNSFVLNLKDTNRATASIVVYGGTYYNFNPANNVSENAGTNFVANGYESVEITAGSNNWKVQQIAE